ncbi:MAG: hypothetical protein WCH76_07825 [Candidatus Riflemargulisbacteria bacterium]
MKNNLELVQELLETRLTSLNEKIDTNNKHMLDVLGFIKEQTTKTNGRVTVLETRVLTLITDGNKHVLNCPRIHEIEKLEEKLEKFNDDNFIIKVINKWPKQVIGVIVVSVILTILATGYSIYQGHEVITEIRTEVLNPAK